MLVNTMVPIFHAQNLLHILKKKKKARIKFMNFSQKYMGSVYWGGGNPVYLLDHANKNSNISFTNVNYLYLNDLCTN